MSQDFFITFFNFFCHTLYMYKNYTKLRTFSKKNLSVVIVEFMWTKKNHQLLMVSLLFNFDTYQNDTYVTFLYFEHIPYVFE